MAEYKNTLVYCEAAEGRLAAITTELLGCGRKLADDREQELCALLIGNKVSDLVQETIAYGTDRVYVVDDQSLKDYQTEPYLLAMEKVIKQVMPEILILGQTPSGRDLAPRLAFRLNTAATLDCIELAIEPGSKRLLQTKPVFGGNALATLLSESYPQIVTVRAKTMSPSQPDAARQGEVITIDAGIDPSAIRTRVLARVPEKVEGIRLEDAKIVIGGGRGIGSAEGFKQLEELAKILRGAVGATRPPCDNEWVPEGLQIGLTGKIISPDLYIAVAISGSSQHITGCSGARNIVTINKDAEANIFKVAHFGVIGDWKQVVPAFTNKVKELLAE